MRTYLEGELGGALKRLLEHNRVLLQLHDRVGGEHLVTGAGAEETLLLDLDLEVLVLPAGDNDLAHRCRRPDDVRVALDDDDAVVLRQAVRDAVGDVVASSRGWASQRYAINVPQQTSSPPMMTMFLTSDMVLDWNCTGECRCGEEDEVEKRGRLQSDGLIISLWYLSGTAPQATPAEIVGGRRARTGIKTPTLVCQG